MFHWVPHASPATSALSQFPAVKDPSVAEMRRASPEMKYAATALSGLSAQPERKNKPLLAPALRRVFQWRGCGIRVVSGQCLIPPLTGAGGTPRAGTLGTASGFVGQWQHCARARAHTPPPRRGGGRRGDLEQLPTQRIRRAMRRRGGARRVLEGEGMDWRGITDHHDLTYVTHTVNWHFRT